MKKIFIDGSAGTTGLRIYDRLSGRSDISLIVLPEEKRKDPEARKEALREADIAFLCLPDDAARESVLLAEGFDTAIIDTSTAHRTADGWVYGFPELTGMKDKIKKSLRIANPGCHASGFISLIRPLTEAKILKTDAFLSCVSLTGYSGAGKKTIAEYEKEDRDRLLASPRLYGLSQTHKHLKEMTVISGLENVPHFSPIICDFYSGMEVSVSVFAKDIRGTLEDISEIYKEYYNGKVVYFSEDADESGFLSAKALEGRDDMEISVFGNDERMTLVSRFDNLGKGASGAAVQNMNILLGEDETTGLVLGGNK